MVKTTDATKVIVNRLFCDRCGAEMENSNWMLACNPPKYEHKCPKCGNREYTLKMYPYVDFEWGKE